MIINYSTLITRSNPALIMAAKTILQFGQGLHKPNERAIVTVTINCREKGREEEDPLIFKEKYQFVIGEPENMLWYKIERSIMNMKEGEESQLQLTVNEKEFISQIELLSFQRGTDQWCLSLDEKLMLASKYKVNGNDHFKKGNYAMAAMFYSKSLKYLISIGDSSKDAVLELRLACVGNLSACQLKLQHYDHTIQNCSRILHEHPCNSKALYRRGVAYLALRDLEHSEVDLLEAKKLEPESSAIASQLRQLSILKEESDKRYQETMRKMFGGDKS